MIVLEAKSSCKPKKKRKCCCIPKKKRCEKQEPRRPVFPVYPCPPKRMHIKKRNRNCYLSPPCFRPVDPVNPVDPVDPGKSQISTVVDKECCGNIMLQGKQPGFIIWENDVDANMSVVQISIFSNSNSSEALEVEVEGETRKTMFVPPGSTTNLIGKGITSVKIVTQGNELSYVEGKYVISTTLQIIKNG
ncbi:hypothetical protein LOZ80_08220 [Paenibacillus sp. HWE-109]|uniref:S-Ena type endospore appendage n=1 Tax=Paenibacillus sp. HWE-109 TaxID=1306526 RepID=UPI001EDD4908|nr:S-Ena type endospore appendage [Paenibacillus sp. HWE-109]UKS28898.1 hypothetical protein LOZ80_08220 [Paenibacillus sp. HWE-109]